MVGTGEEIVSASSVATGDIVVAGTAATGDAVVGTPATGALVPMGTAATTGDDVGGSMGEGVDGAGTPFSVK